MTRHSVAGLISIGDRRHDLDLLIAVGNFGGDGCRTIEGDSSALIGDPEWKLYHPPGMLADPEGAAVFKLLRTGPAAEKEFVEEELVRRSSHGAFWRARSPAGSRPRATGRTARRRSLFRPVAVFKPGGLHNDCRD
jgi:hypothetical protein